MASIEWTPEAIVLFLLVALGAYLLGCVNGAILTSRLFYREDVRTHGSGNAGLTNFYRTYGAKRALYVIGIDMLKAALAVALGVWLFGPDAVIGRYYAAFFCILGHLFPVFYHFKGGKGILCSGMLLLLLDWRIALTGWGIFILLWALTRYVSLGSVCAAFSFPITSALVYRDEWLWGGIVALSAAMAALVIWAHRSNIKRLLTGTESKFQWKHEISEQPSITSGKNNKRDGAVS